MSIVLYGKDGARQIVKDSVDFEAMEKNGWYRKLKMVPEDENSFTDEEIRELAKAEGIEKWDKKHIKTLKKELDLAE